MKELLTGKSVIVTTDCKGVYHGTLVDHDHMHATCYLAKANMIATWGTSAGVDELADTGPTDRSDVCAMVQLIWINRLTSVVLCSEDAIKKWEKYKK